MRAAILLVSVWALLWSEATIYGGGDIVTMRGEKPHYVEAVVTEKGRIVFTGRLADAKHHYKEATYVDLKGRTMLPAFFDPHGHLLLTTLLESYVDLNAPPVGDTDSIATLQKKLKAYIDEHHLKPGEWVIGMNYDDTGMKEGRHPTREDLDAVSKEHPIYIMHSSSHFGVANSLALELAGIDDNVTDPKGGKFYRDEKGRLTGVMEEGAAFAQVMKAITPVAPEAAMKAIEKTLMRRYAAEGMTTVQECGGAMPEFVALLETMAKQGRLELDVLAYPGWEDRKILKKHPPSTSYENGFRLGGVKVIMDGSIQGYTAYLSEPYFRVPPKLEAQGSACDATYKAALLVDTNLTHEVHVPVAKASAKGFVSRPSFKQDELDAIVDEAMRNRWHLMIHCNGDAAIDMVLEAMGKTQLPSDHRTAIVHAQTVREDQLDTIEKLGIYLTLFPSHIYYWGDRHAERFLGPKRTERLDPMRSVIKRNIPYTIHHDSPVTPTSIIDLIAFAVNRTSASGRTYGKDQAMTVYEALKAVTINAARQHFEEKRKGTIEAGKQADFVILSHNPLKTDAKKLRDIKVTETINDGKIVYKSEYVR
jgi:predicted amidohydrolase YtcJ